VLAVQARKRRRPFLRQPPFLSQPLHVSAKHFECWLKIGRASRGGSEAPLGAIDALRETEHKIVYASGGGAELSYEPSFTGEYHFIVVAPDDLQLTITKEGAGSRTGSEYESIVAQVLGFGHADSRAMRLGGRDRATIRVRGNGCALLLIFEVSYR
jgi:hypothetical protein